MRKTILSMTLAIATGMFFGCGNSNKTQSEEQNDSIAMTEENVENQKMAIESESDVMGFFAQYATAFDSNDEAWIDRCDSLLAVYCNDDFRMKVTEELREGVGFDHVTCDNGINPDDIESLKVSPESDGYKVEYTTNTQTPDLQSIKMNVILKVSVTDGLISAIEDLTEND